MCTTPINCFSLFRMTKEINWNDVLVMVQTILGEERTGWKEEMEALASVILTRAHYPSQAELWWGRGIEGVCKKPSQFECWNPENEKLPVIESLNVTEIKLIQVIKIAIQAISRNLTDPTNGATHYYTAGRNHEWAHNYNCSKRIGQYKFCYIGP